MKSKLSFKFNDIIQPLTTTYICPFFFPLLFIYHSGISTHCCKICSLLLLYQRISTVFTLVEKPISLTKTWRFMTFQVLIYSRPQLETLKSTFAKCFQSKVSINSRHLSTGSMIIFQFDVMETVNYIVPMIFSLEDLRLLFNSVMFRPCMPYQTRLFFGSNLLWFYSFVLGLSTKYRNI